MGAAAPAAAVLTLLHLVSGPQLEAALHCAAQHFDSASMDIQQSDTWSSDGSQLQRTSSAMHTNVMPSATST